MSLARTMSHAGATQSGRKIGMHGINHSLFGTKASGSTAASGIATPPSAYSSTYSSQSGASSYVSSVPAKGVPNVPSALPDAAHKSCVIALYDFTGESAGDLSFRAGDRIEIVTRTENTDDWWTGRVGGRTGLFPSKLRLSLYM